MSLKKLFKKSKKTTEVSVPKKATITEETINNIYHETGKKIQEGLSKKTASTGTPIKDLKGAALFTTKMSNIGGGSKATGGGGMEKGFNTVTTHKQAEMAKKMIDQSKKNQKRLNGK